MIAGPARTNLFVLAGLALACVGCWRLLWARSAGPSRLLITGLLGGSLGLISIGFWLSRSTDSNWIIVVVMTTAFLVPVTLRVLDRAAERARMGLTASPPTVSVVLAISTLLLLGALLVIRMVVVSDPAEPFGAGLAPAALRTASSALVQPILVALLAVLVAAWLLAVPRRAWALRVRGRLARWRARPGVRRFTIAWSSDPAIDRRAQDRSRRLVIAVGAVLTVVLFLLPRAGDRTGDAYLYFCGIATPEWGKTVFLLVVAMMATRYQHRYGAVGGIGLRAFLGRLIHFRIGVSDIRATWVKVRHVVLPVGLFLMVALASVIRRDFGTLYRYLRPRSASPGLPLNWPSTRPGPPAGRVLPRGWSGPGADTRSFCLSARSWWSLAAAWLCQGTTYGTGPRSRPIRGATGGTRAAPR